jgi:hypothetical protein
MRYPLSALPEAVPLNHPSVLKTVPQIFYPSNMHIGRFGCCHNVRSTGEPSKVANSNILARSIPDAPDTVAEWFICLTPLPTTL